MKHFMIAVIVTAAALLAAGGETMKDVPVPSNQSIIIFSATGGGTTEGGRVRQNISFAALTAVTVTGGIENDWVRITPSGNSFTAVAKFHKASGSATFTATVTTAGDAEKNLEGMTATFSFRVLVLGVDFPHLTQSFYEFPVGAKVAVTLPVFFAAPEAQLNIAKVPTAITSQTYGEVEIYTDTAHGNINRTRWVGEPSGISIDPTLDEYNYVRGATLSGVALRPGVYYYAFEISSYDSTGQTDPFPGANGYGIVIINVYDDRDAPKICVPYTYVPDDNALRVIRHDREDYASARLTGEFTRSGDIWVRTVSELIAEGVSDVWEYVIARDEATGVWYLGGRNYRSDETAPTFATLASATKTYSGEIPPNTGWTSGVLAVGGNHFFVPGYGFFDKKGERQVPVEGSDPYTGPIYEQQPVVAAQYAGWSNPPATQFADGLYLAPCPDGKWRVSIDPVAINGTEVVKQTVKGMVVPLHPPTSAPPIGGVYYRDLAVLIKDAAGNKIAVNANLPHTPGGLELRIGKITLAIPAHYTFLRQLPPPIGTSDVVNVSFGAYKKTTSETYIGWRYDVFVSDVPDSSRTITETRSSSTELSEFSGSQELNTWTRISQDIVNSVMGMSAGVISNANYEKKAESNSTEQVYQISNYGNESAYDVNNYDKSTITEAKTTLTGSSARGILSYASGRDHVDSRVGIRAAGFAEASATFDTSIQNHRDIYLSETDDHTITNTTATGSGGFAISALSLEAFHSSGFLPGSQKITGKKFSGTMTMSSTASINVQGDSTYKKNMSRTFTLTHERTVYSGDIPVGLVSSGWTHLRDVKTDYSGVTTTTDTWYADADGSTYEAQKILINGVLTVEDPHDWPSSGWFIYTFTADTNGTLSETEEEQYFSGV